MNKIDFKNLPDTTTPLSADNLNLLQDNVENEFTATTTYVDSKADYQDYTLTLPNSITGTATCESKYGIACFTMGIRASSSNIPAYTAIASGVPIPKRVVNFNAVNGSGSTIRMQLSTDGKVYCANEMTNASNYLGTCTYVIDE